MGLIERESELAALSEHLEDIRSGSGALVLVGGEAGAGKSALVSTADFLLYTGRRLDRLPRWR